jgi:hypothetical protein
MLSGKAYDIGLKSVKVEVLVLCVKVRNGNSFKI